MSETENERSHGDPKNELPDVQRLYDSGAPFFTKARIREAYENLLKGKKDPGKRVYTRGLDGKFESFRIESGVFSDHEDDEKLEWIYGRPAIYYISLQSLLDPDRLGLTSSYSNIRIVHYLETRSKVTGELPTHQANVGEEQVKASLERAIDTWGGSQSWEKLKVTLGRFNLALVKKIVAFALSSISEFSDEKDYDNRSAFQHALVVALQGLLSNLSHEHTQPKCYAQDPAYTEHDTNALQTLGITVLPDPEGFLEVDDETLVISISPNVPVKQVVSDIARPALIIWNTITGNGLGVEPSTDPDSPRLQKWIAEHYETLEFPREPDLFGNVSVYVRRTLAGEGPVEQVAI